MAQLFSISEIFDKRILRVPDFQRGYSWGDRQLEDFWDDLEKINKIEVLDEAESVFDFACNCNSPKDIPGFKPLDNYPGYGRIQTGAYRIGLKYSSKSITFYRIIHRSVIYKLFP